MKLFLKGIVAGIGGVSPGLSGSVLLIICGLYQKTLDALATLFKTPGKNLRFLLPLGAGMGVGVLLFSKVLNWLLQYHEMPTRFAFLGLIVGTVPMFYGEVKKQGFSKKYYLVMLLAVAAGLWLFRGNTGLFPQVENPNLLQSVILGAAVATTAIVPGVDPAALLSSIGLYEAYVRALATLELQVLLPMALGLVLGAVVVSAGMSFLFRRFYTATYCVIFGVFLTMIPQMLNESCVLAFDGRTAVSLLVMVLGFALSYYLGDLEENNRKLKKLLKKEA